MRKFLFVLLLAACGGGDGGLDRDRQVSALDDAELVTLCEQFSSRVCESADFSEWCAQSCHLRCDDPEVPAMTREECPSPRTVGEVLDCADAVAETGQDAFELCLMGGGCEFDVGDRLCDGEL